MKLRSVLLGLVLASPALAAPKPLPAAVPAAAPAPAPPPSVRAGVDLWRAGDWAGAVAIWQPFAVQGDPDAMFNMGQAYKLGRAVPMDKAVARDWYRKAALKGHLPAEANLGILLFQAGEKPEAARWLKTAADRGEMRAQYVLGVAHWNGDGVPKSLPLAWAYLSRASAQGLTEATTALGNLGRSISPAERANGTSIAASLAAGAGVPASFAPVAAPVPAAPGATPMTVAELNRRNLEAAQRQAPPEPMVPRPNVAATPAPAIPAPVVPPARPITTPVPAPKPPVPEPAAAAAPPTKPAIAPTITAAPPAVLVTQPTSQPRPVEPPSKPAVAAPAEPEPVKPAESAKGAVPTKPAEKPVEKATDKPKAVEKSKAVEPPPGWRVQLGAFGKRAQAEAAWDEVKARQKAAVGSAKPIYEPGGSIIKLQIGPYKTRDEAKDACAKIAFSGRACFVTEGGGKASK